MAFDDAPSLCDAQTSAMRDASAVCCSLLFPDGAGVCVSVCVWACSVRLRWMPSGDMRGGMGAKMRSIGTTLITTWSITNTCAQSSRLFRACGYETCGSSAIDPNR